MTDALPTPTTTLRRMKRSRSLQMTGFMASIGFSLSACGAPERIPVAEPAEPALAYTSLEDCRTADVVPDTECATSWQTAQTEAERSGPRYATQAECEGQWGPEQCRRLSTGGGSFFGPLATGFIIGQLMNGGGYRGGGPLYRDRNGQYSNGYGGGYMARDYRTGRNVANARDHTPAARQAPTRVQNRTTVVSRGGFGGGGRGYGG